jgi:TP901 family phage tail tape measure protein
MAGFNLTAQLNIVGPNNLKPVISNLRKQLSSAGGSITLNINPNISTSVNNLNKSLQSLDSTLKSINASASSVAASLRQIGSAAGTVNIKSVPKDIAAVTQQSQKLQQQQSQTAVATKASTDSMVEFGKQSALAIRRFAAFTLVTGIIYKVTSAFGNASAEFIKFNQQMVQLSQVTGSSLQNLAGLERTITSLSTSLGVSSSSLIDVSSTLAQAGLSAQETEEALSALAKTTLAPSFGNLNNTVEGSIALMRQFAISTGQLESALGSINTVAAKFAVEADDIITAIQRTGGVFAASSKGVAEGTEALNQFIAIFTSVRATTRESAETIATGLRTIFTRIQRRDTIELLKQYGIQLTDLEGKFVGPYEAVKRLSQGLAGLDTRDVRFSSIIEELGGFRQVGKVIPLLQQFTVAERALMVAQRGQGSLTSDAAKAQQALAIQMAKVQEEFVAMVRKIGSSNEFQTMVKMALNLASAFIQVADSAKYALPAITALLAVKGTIGAFRFASGFASGMRRGGGAAGLGERLSGAPRGYAQGGQIPVALEPGEMVFVGESARRAGYGNLRRLNRAGDRPNPREL